MIASWMIAATLLGACAVLAATALERALRLLGRQARFAWVLALSITIAWPLLAPALLRPSEPRAEVSVISAGAAIDAVTAATPDSRTPAVISAARAVLARLDLPLLLLWGTSTLLLLLRAGIAMRALRRLAHRAERRTIDGQAVLVSPSVGPAAFGVLRPHIVLPSWSLDLDPPTRAMVLRHEQEHLAARDPAILTFAGIGVALMPWNAALWILARRLRIATELDCDHRVVGQGTDARRYAQLLLLMVQRQAPATFAALMAGSPTTLHQRIDAMHIPAPTRPRIRAAALLVLTALVASAAAAPALANQLATVRTTFAPAVPQPTVQRRTRASTPPSARSSVLELPLVVVSPDRSVEVPFTPAPEPQAVQQPVLQPVQQPAQQPPQRTRVDSTLKPVAFAPGGSPTPRYPDALRSAGVSGDLVVQVVVDSSGLPMQGTIKIVRNSHDLFEASFRDVFSQIRFSPATLGDRRVHQLIQLIYRFDFEDAPEKPDPAMSPTLATFVIDVTVMRR